MPRYNQHINNINRTVTTYSPTDMLRLHASERDLSFNSDMYKSFLDKLSEDKIRYYPNNNMAYNLLEKFTGYNESNLVLFDGSDRAIRDIFHVYCSPHTSVITTSPSFPMYEVYTYMFNGRYVGIPYIEIFPEIEIINAISDDTSIVILSNPSSPQGQCVNINNILMKCIKCDCMLVLDEAYIEFSDIDSFDPREYQNVIVIKTLSKAYGSAGMRIGYSVSNVSNTQLLKKVSSMNQISSPSIAWLATCIEFEEDIKNYIRAVKRNRTELVKFCKKMGINVLDSSTNFIHIQLSYLKNVLYKKIDIGNEKYLRISIPADMRNMEIIMTDIENECGVSKNVVGNHGI